MRIILTISLVLIMASSYAQSRKERKAQERQQQQGPTSLDPLPRERELPKQTRKRAATKGPTYNAESDYYERVEAFAKTQRKNEKLLMRPQYSDPSYFGHKRPPKKRPPNKMKFCKECGIRH